MAFARFDGLLQAYGTVGLQGSVSPSPSVIVPDSGVMSYSRRVGRRPALCSADPSLSRCTLDARRVAPPIAMTPCPDNSPQTSSRPFGRGLAGAL